MMRLKRVEEICARFKDKRVLVFGDVILDRYIFGRVDRISPEAPVPVVKVESEETRVGGAGNTAANIDKLGATGVLMGIIGDDPYGEMLVGLKTGDSAVVRCGHNRTLVKTRIISQRQQMVRIDREEPVRVTPESEGKVLSLLSGFRRGDLHGIIVSDYAKGTLTETVMGGLRELARRHGIPVMVDPKPPNFHLYRDVDGITPNLMEAEMMVGRRIAGDSGAADAVRFIRNRFRTRFSVVTRGAGGITAGERGKKIFHVPAFNQGVYDVTGAGDTVVSVLLLSLISGGTLRESVALANGAASLVVQRVGASQVTLEELCHRMRDLLRGGTR